MKTGFFGMPGPVTKRKEVLNRKLSASRVDMEIKGLFTTFSETIRGTDLNEPCRNKLYRSEKVRRGGDDTLVQSEVLCIISDAFFSATFYSYRCQR